MRYKIYDKKCGICKVTFHPTHHNIKYCSHACANASRKGQPSWNKGLKGYRAGNKHHWFGRDVKGDKNPSWKGDKVGYRGLHYWVEQKLGKPNFCEKCRNGKLKNRQYQWANISGKYLRVTTDWKRLCVKCHKAFDKNRTKKN